MTYAVAFALTLLVELPVYGALLARRHGVRLRTALLAAVGVNAVTHPLLWLAVSRYQHTATGYAVAFVVGEALVCLVEGALLSLALRRHRLRRVVWPVVVLANMASAGCGLVLALAT